MSNPARLPESSEPRDAALPSGLPVIINARDVMLPAMPAHDASLRLIETPANASQPAAPAKALGRKKDSDVLRGIKDLQQLQKQTIAVLESVKGTLDDIAQVLRSPEATRGMEKQQNAATLLAKGFVRDAVEQANGAVALLPANPEAHLLLSLSLAADQQFDAALAVARKGLALIDRRNHPLAIECGLLHALAALGCSGEAIDRWAVIVETLPLPVLFEQLPRIAACFPTEGLGGGAMMLDDMVNRRLVRDEQAIVDDQANAPRMPGSARERLGKIDLRPDEIPAGALFIGLDVAKDFALSCTHRAILAQVARRLQLVRDAGDVVRFLTECVVPLGNRALDRSATALGRAAVKRLLKFHADVPTLHRAMGKLELAGATVAVQEIASLLNHWRRAGRKVARAHRMLMTSALLMLAGVMVTIYVMWFLGGVGALRGAATMMGIAGVHFEGVWVGPILLSAGSLIGVIALFGRTWHVALPENRPPLSPEEQAYLKTPSVRQSLRGALALK